MTPEKLRQVRRIFDAAMESDPGSRSTIVTNACQGDETLRSEVEKLLAAHEPTQGLPDEGVSSRPGSYPSAGHSLNLEPGTVLAGRYTILELLGQGGMGAVYRALDGELTGPGHDGIIAIKVILPELAQRPQFLRRFKEELLLARKIGHKNVVRIFNWEKAGEIVFFTMEFVQGQNLKALLEEKVQYSPYDAVTIVSQLAEGLQAIHEANVIHRDLKTRNVMMQPNGQVVLMDFGLARSSALLDDTQTLAVMGTPGYMAPEQILGKAIDQRSDLYSLGIILYELLTGQLPFGRDFHSRLAHMKEGGKPAPLASTIPSDLNRIVRKCLAEEPQDRYQTATELLADLHAFLQPPSPPPQATPFWKITSVIFAALSIVFAAYVIRSVWMSPSPPHSPVSLLIADFDNSTGDPDFAGGTLESILSIALEGAPFITSYDRGQARKTTRLLSGTDMITEKLAHQVAVREGIQDIVAGTLIRKGKGYELSIQVIGAGTSNVLVSRRAEAETKQAVLDTTNKLAGPIRKALGEIQPPPQTAETFTAASVPAIHSYAIAQELQLEGKRRESIPHYEHAIQLDPDLGRAYAGVAVAYYNLRQTDEALKYYQEALKRIDRMTDREKYRTRGGYYVTSGNIDKAIEEYSELVKRYPADNAGLANLALAWFYRRDMQRALDIGRRAVAIYPKNVSQLNNVALYAMYSGDFRTAVQEAAKVLKLNPSYEPAFVATALSQVADGHVEEATKAYEQLQAVSADGASLAALGLADIALYEGRVGEATKILERAISGDLAAHNRSAAAIKLTALANAWLLLDKPEDASAAAIQAVSLNDKSEEVLFPAARVLLETQRTQARTAIDALARSSKTDAKAYLKLIEGELALKDRDYETALTRFLEAQKIADTWVGRLDLGRAYLESGKFPEADSEVDECMRRRGEATSIFLDERPTYRYFPPVYYYLGRAREGLKSSGAAESYRNFLSIKAKADRDPMVSDARTRLGR